MSIAKKYPLPIYDPPVVYDSFSGGINTSLSNETLEQNEIRDGLNCHYSNNALVNRPGATLMKHLVFPFETDRYQGDFIYATTYNVWIISVRNGHIFWGDYNSGDTVYMQLLKVNLHHTEHFDDTDNYLVNLATKTEIDYTEQHEGFIYRYPIESSGEGEDEEHDEEQEVEYEETLIVQNTKRVQGIPVDDYFLMATGTRILKIIEYEDPSQWYSSPLDHFGLYGEILEAAKPSAWEFKNIGENNLSPFSQYHIAEVDGTPQTEIGTILTEPKELALDQTDWTFKAIISCLAGYDKSDYYYKWEVKVQNKTDWITLWHWNASQNPNSGSSKGVYTLQTSKAAIESALGLTLAEGDGLLVRCSLTSEFASTYSVADRRYYYDTDETGDYVSEQAKAIYSRTHVTKVIRDTYEPGIRDVNQYFYYIHSCTKIIADGQKALLYDDNYGTCEWFKTVIQQYNYICYNGGLSFKTTKNEKLVGVVVFDTNIVVFADNDQLGGNISVVTGNGDDYNADDYYSPYKRSIVNTNISCDAYNTIQVCDNSIIFKYRNDIYMLDTTGLSNTDTVKVETVNDMVKQRLNNIEFPLNRVRQPKLNEHLIYDFHELNQCLKPDEIFSEVNDGFYGIIFPNQGFFKDTLDKPTVIDKYYEGTNPEYEGALIENVSIKPGLRWKMYYRDGTNYPQRTKTFYPWLRDVSYLFDIVSVINIEGIHCFVRKNGDLFKFDRPDGTGYTGDEYLLRLKTKAYDMDSSMSYSTGVVPLTKFLDSCNIYFNRDFDAINYMTAWIHNEAGYEIYGPENDAYITLRSGLTDQVRYGERIKFDDALNLRDIDKPIKQYEDHPYIDATNKPVEILNEYKGIKDDKGNWINPVLDRPSYSAFTLTPRWRFPFLSAQLTIEVRINQAFSFSSLNFSYTSVDMPEFTREKLYREIIRR